jgi:hypothetical protein
MKNVEILDFLKAIDSELAQHAGDGETLDLQRRTRTCEQLLSISTAIAVNFEGFA